MAAERSGRREQEDVDSFHQCVGNVLEHNLYELSMRQGIIYLVTTSQNKREYSPTRSKMYNQTIDCLNDIISLLLSLKGCIDLVLINLGDGDLERVETVINLEDILNDLNELMSVYQDSIYFSADIEFYYIHFLSLWKGIIEAYFCKPTVWCMRHTMPLKQFLCTINELQAKLVREIQLLSKD